VSGVDKYAATIVEKYRVIPEPGSMPHQAADAVIPTIKQWANQYLLGITLSGAYAKNTAIELSAHVDLLVSVKPIPGMDIKAIFWNLFEFLTKLDFQPRTHNVAIRVRSQGLNLDIIPALRDTETSGHILFDKRSAKAVHTDVGKHVHLIANSGRQQEICALKIWRERNGLGFPSLYLELTTLHALEHEPFGHLHDNILAALRYLPGHFAQTIVRDPANPDNIVSNDLSADEKKTIAEVARDVVYDENWKKILW
jgi:hypothetical protein